MLQQSPEDYFRKSITVLFLYCTLNEMKSWFTDLHGRTALGLQLVPSIIEKIAPQPPPPPSPPRQQSLWIRPCIKSPTSAKSSKFAFNKNFILFNGISSIKSGLFNIILLNKLFLREWLAVHFKKKWYSSPISFKLQFLHIFSSLVIFYYLPDSISKL